MKPIPVTPETIQAARRIIWFEAPERALADPVRFMAYAMTYAMHEDMRAIRRYVSDDDFREALDRAPPGIIDPRSWAYWNSKMGRYPPPPAPVRTFGSTAQQYRRAPSEGPRSVARPSSEEMSKQAREDWQRLRTQMGPVDLEEVRRRAREEWLAKYHPDKKK